MFSSDNVLEMQQVQYLHDKRNHSDILSLHKNDRLKHYGLHFCKYVGRLARGRDEEKSAERTIIDTILVCLSAANTLHQKLPALCLDGIRKQNGVILPFADAAGRFADACEKIDHQEEFLSIARAANVDIFLWALENAHDSGLDVISGTSSRRQQLSERQFFIKD